MKKVLVVLLVAVMTLTSAFAAVSGSVSAKLTYDLNDGYFDYATANSVKAKFEFKEALGASATGALKPYVDVALSATIKFDKNFANDSVALDLDTFKIVGNKWVLDFIPEYAATDLATDVIDGRYVLNDDKDDYAFNPFTYSWAIVTDNAVSFQYDGIGTLTVGADKYRNDYDEDAFSYEIINVTAQEWADYEAEDGIKYYNPCDLSEIAAGTDTPKSWVGYVVEINEEDELEYVVPQYAVAVKTLPEAANRGADFAIAFESEDIALVDADKLTFKGAVGYSYGWDAIKHKNTYDFGASAKASYMDYATVAADMGFHNAEFFDADIAAHIVYAPVTFDAYWATNADVFNYDGDGFMGYLKKDLISLKAVVDVEEINTKFTAIASDIAKKKTNRVSFEAVNTSLEKYTFTLGLTDIAHKKGIAINAKVEADFSEDLSANAGFKCGLQKGAPATFSAGVDYTGIENLTLSAKGEVATGKKDFVDSVKLEGSALYEAALFDAEFDVAYRTYFDTEEETYSLPNPSKAPKFENNNKDFQGLVLGLDLSSDKIVDGAKIGFKWQSGKLSDMNGKDGDFGKLTASCTVEF